MLVLSELGISVAPILGAAGVVGLAVGFGAQSLVKDYFTGFFLLLENQIRQGDVVKLGDHAGLVEEVTLRYVQLRDYDGNVHFVPNGTITHRRQHEPRLRAGGDRRRRGLPARTSTSVDGRDARGRRARCAHDPRSGRRILDDLEIAGVEQLGRLGGGASAAASGSRRCEQWTVRREYLRRLEAAFDEHGIEIPFPHMTVYAGDSKDGTAPALPL